MALEQQIKNIPLYGSIDTKTDEKYVAWNSTLTADNVQFFGIQRAAKRYGQTALSTEIGGAGSISTGKAIGVYQSELLVYDGTKVYAHASSQDRWYSRGNIAEVSVEVEPVIRSAGSVSGITNILLNDTEAYAWEDSRGGVYYALRDPVSGTFIVTPTQVDALGYNPQFVTMGSTIYLLYSVSTSIYAAKILSANPASGIVLTQQIITDVIASSPFASNATDTEMVVTYFSGSTPGDYTTSIFNTNLSITAQANFTLNATALTANLTYSTDKSRLLFLAAVSGSGYYYVPITNGTGVAGAVSSAVVTTIARASAVGTGASDIQIFYDSGTTGSIPALNTATVSFSDATTVSIGSVTTLYGVQIASKPVVLDSIPYIVCSSPLVNLLNDTSQQTAFYLCSGIPAATPVILQRFLGSSAYVGGISLPQLISDGTTISLGVAARTALRADATGTVFSQTGLSAVYFTFPDTSQFRSVPFNTTAVISCGNTWTYDGSQIVESGFWEFPDGITATALGSGGSLNAGTYYYVITYEWVDAAGNSHYSAGSYPVEVTTVANDAVELTIPYTALTRKTDAVIAVYRTADAPGGGTATGLGPWFKVPLSAIPNTPGLSGTTSVTVTDTFSDLALQGQQTLYAPPDGSGELDNDPPPPFAFVVATKTRMFGVAQDDRMSLWYSKPMAPGRPVEWSGLQIVNIETDGGAVTALGALDTQAVVFKQRRVYYLPGDGPNAAGQGGSFPDLQLISSTTGCVSQPSVLSTQDGLFFKSPLGLQLLNRSLTMDTSIGLPVQGYNALSVTGAVVAADQNQLRWTTSDGVALIFDYVTKRWCTYSNYESVGYVGWNDTYARLLSSGAVWYEDSSTYLDNLQPVIMTIETAWLKPADFAQGFAAVWYAEILGSYISSHQLVVEIYYDYMEQASQVSVWNAGALVDRGTYGSGAYYGSDVVYGSSVVQNTAQYQLRIALQRQVCEAVKFKIFDSSTTGASCDLNEIALQLGIIGGLNRVPTTQQV